MNLEIMRAALNELSEADVNIDEDTYRYDGFPHIRLSPERARHYSKRLHSLVNDILNESPDPNGTVYFILVAMFMMPAYLQGPFPSTSSESTLIVEEES